VAATLGLSLVLMALEITRAKSRDAALPPVIDEGRLLLARLGAHADHDVAAFTAYMQALALPKATEEERAQRSAALQEAATGATEAPLGAAADVVLALGYAERACALAGRGVMSDVLAGADIAFGALCAVLRNVDINLPTLKDALARERFARRAEALSAEGRAIYGRIQAIAGPRPSGG
jgi:formiminotetrahydrofolate cyclodeaminase